MGGPEMAPQTPQRSERPGGAVALLYLAYLASPHPAPLRAHPGGAAAQARIQHVT
jgi:hypothetical protein